MIKHHSTSNNKHKWKALYDHVKRIFTFDSYDFRMPSTHKIPKLELTILCKDSLIANWMRHLSRFNGQ